MKLSTFFCILFLLIINDNVLTDTRLFPIVRPRHHVCPRCGQMYSWASNLRKHLKSGCGLMTCETHFACQYCPFRSRVQASFLKHLVSVHHIKWNNWYKYDNTKNKVNFKIQFYLGVCGVYLYVCACMSTSVVYFSSYYCTNSVRDDDISYVININSISEYIIRITKNIVSLISSIVK